MFSCSDGSSNFSVLNFVVVVVCLENMAPEFLHLYVRICIAFFFFLLSCLILCFRKKIGKSGSQHFIHMLFLINCWRFYFFCCLFVLALGSLEPLWWLLWLSEFWAHWFDSQIGNSWEFLDLGNLEVIWIFFCFLMCRERFYAFFWLDHSKLSITEENAEKGCLVGFF